jgi:hypothetical protein
MLCVTTPFAAEAASWTHRITEMVVFNTDPHRAASHAMEAANTTTQWPCTPIEEAAHHQEGHITTVLHTSLLQWEHCQIHPSLT